MKRTFFILFFLLNVFFVKAQDKIEPTADDFKWYIEVYLCSEDDKIVFDEIKTKLTESQMQFSEEIDEAESKCMKVVINCSSLEACDEIFVTLDGKKIKIRSGLHSDDLMAAIFNKLIFKIKDIKGSKIFEVTDRESNRIIYQRRLYVSSPLTYTNTVKTRNKFGDKQLEAYEKTPSFINRATVIKSLFDRMSISMSIRSKSK